MDPNPRPVDAQAPGLSITDTATYINNWFEDNNNSALALPALRKANRQGRRISFSPPIRDLANDPRKRTVEEHRSKVKSLGSELNTMMSSLPGVQDPNRYNGGSPVVLTARLQGDRNPPLSPTLRKRSTSNPPLVRTHYYDISTQIALPEPSTKARLIARLVSSEVAQASAKRAREVERHRSQHHSARRMDERAAMLAKEGHVKRRKRPSSLVPPNPPAGSEPADPEPTRFPAFPRYNTCQLVYDQGAAVAVARDNSIPSLEFGSQFESGNLLRAVRVGPREYDLVLRPDTNTSHPTTQWFYFSAAGLVPGIPYRFNIVNFTKPKSCYSDGLRPLVCSETDFAEAGVGWRRCGYDISYFPNSIPKGRAAKRHGEPNRFGGVYTPHTAGKCCCTVCAAMQRHRETPGSASKADSAVASGARVDQGSIQKRAGKQEPNDAYPPRNSYRHLSPAGPSRFFTLSFSFASPSTSVNDTLYFAHCYPYRFTDLQDYLDALCANPKRNKHVHCKTLCTTLGGKQCPLLTITKRKLDKEQRRRNKVIVLSARVHPGESNSSWIMKGVIDFLTSSKRIARALRRRFVFKIVPMLNPDGVAAGNYRTNLAGFDLNRTWATPSSRLQPPIFSLKQLMAKAQERHGVALFLDVHGHSVKKNIFAYGCENNSNPMLRSLEKIFPRVLWNLSDIFSFHDCSFGVQRSKSGTGRVVARRELGIVNAFTIESSFFGSDFGDYHNRPYTQQTYINFGKRICRAVFEAFFKPVARHEAQQAFGSVTMRAAIESNEKEARLREKKEAFLSRKALDENGLTVLQRAQLQIQEIYHSDSFPMSPCALDGAPTLPTPCQAVLQSRGAPLLEEKPSSMPAAARSTRFVARQHSLRASRSPAPQPYDESGLPPADSSEPLSDCSSAPDPQSEDNDNNDNESEKNNTDDADRSPELVVVRALSTESSQSPEDALEAPPIVASFAQPPPLSPTVRRPPPTEPEKLPAVELASTTKPPASRQVLRVRRRRRHRRGVMHTRNASATLSNRVVDMSPLPSGRRSASVPKLPLAALESVPRPPRPGDEVAYNPVVSDGASPTLPAGAARTPRVPLPVPTTFASLFPARRSGLERLSGKDTAVTPRGVMPSRGASAKHRRPASGVPTAPARPVAHAQSIRANGPDLRDMLITGHAARAPGRARR
eukprot:gnl/Chilomastix_cuspidata/1699.p1 GENE.gnl/Chilomastix_cuspidata/1699~~gnl/Chilomastix_cuspidata/1699.p1  ORF type:complete len:1173 (-),score=269.10 gnl/Chilomastix_cuspidata/1699:25-3543(-)